MQLYICNKYVIKSDTGYNLNFLHVNPIKYTKAWKEFLFYLKGILAIKYKGIFSFNININSFIYIYLLQKESKDKQTAALFVSSANNFS